MTTPKRKVGVRAVQALSAALFLATTTGAQGVPSLPQAEAQTRAQAVLEKMTLDEKIGQVSMAHFFRFLEGRKSGPITANAGDIFAQLLPGATLNGGGDAPQPNTPRGWADALRGLEALGRQNLPGGVPAVFGTDSVHGVNNVPGATLYPHNLGLGAAFNPALTQELARATAADMRAMNMDWDFSPVADLGRDPRWGRFYETFGESPWLVADQITASVQGLQSGGVAATLKHFVGYGSPGLGRDRANAEISTRALHELYLPPFKAGIRAGAMSVMANSGSVNGVPVHASQNILTDLLRGELGFKGLVVSDWNDIDRLVNTFKTHADLVRATAASVNAGIDLYMVPNDVEKYGAALKEAVEGGLVSRERLDEAALRMLTFKAQLGLMDARPAGSGVIADGRALAKRAAAATLTLLENDETLPVKKGRVLVTGPAMDSAAIQLGGWSVNWQGVGKGNVSYVPKVSTLATALKASAPAGVTVSALPDGKREALLKAAKSADTIIVALGEAPAAESQANNPELALPTGQVQLLRDLLGTGKPVVLVLMAGRPILLPEDLQNRLPAFVMAYLPGSEGGAALADALYGRAGFPGRLPFTWPGSLGEVGLTADRPPEGAGDAPLPLYPLGFGLDYTAFRTGDGQAVKTANSVKVSVTVTNTGTATFIVRASLPPAGNLEAVGRPVGVVQVSLKPSEARKLTLVVPVERLEAFTGDAFGGVRGEVLPGQYTFEIGDESARLSLP
ncbi:beta-glucosidase [Deinococcus arenicola]|uniref:beta-glucosidase n=1 Tax=Deinococcus arenicola TaxID=2994950 RepID=A0ABU4DNI5_9DEIO|nr:glycoside hydrolase family 3 N-terminal domain-containing protein [Deinococcus sp. ZS9-10]MDV6374004.1 glycoside hydrolase family 3 C-terminal domain-containing protein [Deinococcus sp. ZS9-10]